MNAAPGMGSVTGTRVLLAAAGAAGAAAATGSAGAGAAAGAAGATDTAGVPYSAADCFFLFLSTTVSASFDTALSTAL